jgi:hypothetical protein
MTKEEALASRKISDVYTSGIEVHLDGYNVQELVDEFVSFAKEHKFTPEQVTLEVSAYDDYVESSLYGSRPATEEEIEQRYRTFLATEAARRSEEENYAKEAEKRERAELKRLLEKYGKEI